MSTMSYSLDATIESDCKFFFSHPYAHLDGILLLKLAFNMHHGKNTLFPKLMTY